MSEKIFPLNLTARAAVKVAGNPVVTRLEDGVGNCFPGLEFDHRNLDRRFFPGMVWNFVSADSQANVHLGGARLLLVDTSDPALQDTRIPADAATRLQQDVRKFSGSFDSAAAADLSQGAWYLSSISQGGKKISCQGPGSDGTPQPFDGITVWRLVRSLEPAEVTITVDFRPGSANGTPPQPSTFTFTGWRRAFTDPDSGVISQEYEPGELSQSLCSPWQHDFRDCGCNYWASNHPDIALGEERPGEATLPSGDSEDPLRASIYVDWLRADLRLSATSAAQSGSGDRTYQLDHYEINQRWQDRPMVLERRETPIMYRPSFEAAAQPFDSVEDLATHLRYLATLEHVLALEYLYATFSVVNPTRVDAATQAKFPDLVQDLTFVRHELLAVAVSEMRHLRWVNEILWKLSHEGLIKEPFVPEFGVAERVPLSGKPGDERDRQLRPLDRKTLEDFISVEEPSGGVDGQYARVLSTLKLPRFGEELGLYPIASRIIAEGMQHYTRFRSMRLVLKGYEDPTPPYLQPIQVASKTDAAQALSLYASILELLRKGYETGDAEESFFIAQARTIMFQLNDEAEALAVKNLGIPFF
ncbi:MAG: ferritin-like domain-containing protein [Bryobacteraceae bacterium]